MKNSRILSFRFISTVKILTILFIFGITFFGYSCKEPDVQIIEPPAPLPEEQYVLFALSDGAFKGLKLYDIDSIGLIDSFFYYFSHSPVSVVVSPDYKYWYTVVRSFQNTRSFIKVDVQTKTVVSETPSKNSNVLSDHKNKYLITYNYSIQIFDRTTFSLVHEDSLGQISPMVASPTEMKIYGFKSYTGDRIIVYNLENFQVEDTIQLQESGGPADICITEDGRYLFVTVSYPLIDIGFFQVIDLSTKTVVASYPCGNGSQMGLSPDGKHVYVSDPAGYYKKYYPQGKFWRYSVDTKTWEVFIDWIPYHLTEWYGGRLLTDKIVVSPDNRYLFISTFFLGKTPDGLPIDIMKVDIETKQIVDVLSLPYDSTKGVEHIFELKINKIIK